MSLAISAISWLLWFGTSAIVLSDLSAFAKSNYTLPIFGRHNLALLSVCAIWNLACFGKLVYRSRTIRTGGSIIVFTILMLALVIFSINLFLFADYLLWKYSITNYRAAAVSLACAIMLLEIMVAALLAQYAFGNSIKGIQTRGSPGSITLAVCGLTFANDAILLTMPNMPIMIFRDLHSAMPADHEDKYRHSSGLDHSAR